MTKAIEAKLVRGKMFSNLTREVDRVASEVWFIRRRYGSMTPAKIVAIDIALC